MATTTDRCPITPRPDPDERYVALVTDDGDTIIYDQEVESAWIQSEFAIDVDAMA